MDFTVGAKNVKIDTKWICNKLEISNPDHDKVKTIVLRGTPNEKISTLGISMLPFTNLKLLDLSRNSIKVLDGLDHLRILENLNLYFNVIEDYREITKLRYNTALKIIDLRLNPIARKDPDYRIFLISKLAYLSTLDNRSVTEVERRTALQSDSGLFTQLEEPKQPLKHLVYSPESENELSSAIRYFEMEKYSPEHDTGNTHDTQKNGFPHYHHNCEGEHSHAFTRYSTIKPANFQDYDSFSQKQKSDQRHNYFSYSYPSSNGNPHDNSLRSSILERENEELKREVEYLRKFIKEERRGRRIKRGKSSHYEEAMNNLRIDSERFRSELDASRQRYLLSDREDYDYSPLRPDPRAYSHSLHRNRVK
ncbi:centrosomal protein 72kDa [Cichlidogyrus casuarinus]|uniref:Centrosomal protein 72kDa n=1 Tax=Cichlidogyrus casuarinus TaxID=1844966 RepID=A0ABD2QDA4_9PLAT